MAKSFCFFEEPLAFGDLLAPHRISQYRAAGRKKQV